MPIVCGYYNSLFPLCLCVEKISLISVFAKNRTRYYLTQGHRGNRERLVLEKYFGGPIPEPGIVLVDKRFYLPPGF
ncbi:MAG: hypothetical protein JWQ78_1635 [Sediminibacterium sp.]|nr:hypothetical protein [Sediminibacterium sp.]